jgi:hypothetical protein
MLHTQSRPDTSAVRSGGRALGSLLILMALLSACVSIPRRPAPPLLIDRVAPVGFRPDIRFLSIDGAYVLTHLSANVRAADAAANGGPLRILALSGGGAAGAFGAGVLYGLQKSGRRPAFQVVTGVSAGALLAPFAFLGPKWDRQLKEAFDGNREHDLLQPRGLGFLFVPGLYRGRPLEELVSRFCTQRLVAAVAARARQGRLLLVATTDLDKEQSVIWNMGAIAERGGADAHRLFCKVLVASASIPGIFPPVLMHVTGGGRSYDEMQVDGGTTLPFFIASEIAEALRIRVSAFRGAHVYVIVNGRLNAYPTTTPMKPMAVLLRSVAAASMSASRRALEESAEFARRNDMRFRFTYLPATFRYGGSLDFKFANMNSLFEFGSRCAQSGRIWSTLLQAIVKGQRAASAPPKPSDECPGSTIAVTPRNGPAGARLILAASR